MSSKIDFNDRMLSLGLARVSEAAAIASADLIGRGDEKAADQAAVNAMRDQLNKLDISGFVVIGEGERDEAPMLYIGEEVGTGNGPGVDIALDTLEGTTLTAKDMPNALTVIAMGPRGSMLHAPDVYMEKLAIGPGYKSDVVTLEMSPSDRIISLAKAKKCNTKDITVYWIGRDIKILLKMCAPQVLLFALLLMATWRASCIAQNQTQLELICTWELAGLRKEYLLLLL